MPQGLWKTIKNITWGGQNISNRIASLGTLKYKPLDISMSTLSSKPTDQRRATVMTSLTNISDKHGAK
jgi:hypothetical protein